jgi:hypothetical protein
MATLPFRHSWPRVSHMPSGGLIGILPIPEERVAGVASSPSPHPSPSPSACRLTVLNLDLDLSCMAHSEILDTGPPTIATLWASASLPITVP